MEKKVVVHTEQETIKLAARLSQLLRPGDVITLEGDLGTGKTTFTKGIANGLGVKRMVTSPTFTIVKEYEGELPLYHMDVYRLENSEEDIGFEEYFNGNGITVIEWAHFIDDYLPTERLEIHLAHRDEHARELTFYPKGERFKFITKVLIG